MEGSERLRVRLLKSKGLFEQNLAFGHHFLDTKECKFLQILLGTFQNQFISSLLVHRRLFVAIDQGKIGKHTGLPGIFLNNLNRKKQTD
jgi:hypothetical protein